MGVSSRRKIVGGDGYRELAANESLAEERLAKRATKTYGNDPILKKRKEKEKFLLKLKKKDSQNRRISARAAKIKMPNS